MSRSFSGLTLIICVCVLVICSVVKIEGLTNETPEALFQQAEQISSTNVDRAIELYQRALELNPSVDVAHDIWVSLANSYASSGNIRQAVDYFIKIAEYRRERNGPGVDQIYFNIGLAFSQMTDWTNALVYYEKALDVNPNFVSAIIKCAYIYNLQGKSDKVVLYLQQAIHLQPGNVHSYLYLGDTLNNLKRWNEAATVYQNGLKVQPNHPELHLAFANTLNNLELLPQAYKHYKKAVDLGGNGFPPSLVGLVIIKRELALWDDWKNLINNMMQSCKELIKQGQNSIISPYNALYLPISPQDQMDIAVNYAKGVFKVKQSVENRLTEPPQQEKKVIHIGYISTRFKKYAGAQLMLRIFGLHDRTKFKIFSYSHGPDDQGGSIEREIIRNTSDVFRDLYHMDNLEAAQVIKNDNIDILIDCNGIHDENSLEILVFRPAPIQVTYLGFPGTTGASGIFDYIITDRFVTPELAGYFVEKPAYMPNSFFPYDHLTTVANATLTRAEYGLPESSFVYCSFNRLNKIEPEVFGSWMKIMKRVDNSVMWLFSGEKHEAEQNLLNEAQKQGVNGSRIVFARKSPKPEHLARQKLCDLFLDTFYYDAHTTAADALWVGLPLLSLPGQTFASRVAGSLLKAAGVGDEMIAASKQDYEDKAVDYATTKNGVLKTVREKLETKQHRLFDGPQYVKELEGLYKNLLQKEPQAQQEHSHDEL